jgi:hypothetical protein
MVDIIIATNKLKEEINCQIKEIKSNTPEDHRIIATCQPLSASKNRNYGLSYANTDIIIMTDDDVTSFYKGWLTDLIKPMLDDLSIMVCAPRLLDKNRNYGHMMGGSKIPKDNGVYESERFRYKNYYRLPTALIAFRKNNILFDENFIGSGYEDSDWCNQLNINFPDKKMVINNNCKLVHINEEKNQGGRYFEHNKAYYLQKYPDDPTVINQKDWTKRKR